jgi:formate-dependent nitrite reductase membrane component NrfD
MSSTIAAILFLLGIAAVAVAGAGYLIDQERQQIEREVKVRAYA